jgi:hypothetical protein
VLILRYKTLHHQAKHIDHLIDEAIAAKRSAFPTKEELEPLIQAVFPDFYVVNAGWHKVVFGICSPDQKIVLKIGSKKNIEYDHRVYKSLPENMRHRFFAKIYWHTKYCLLQEYGFPASVSPEQLTSLRQTVYRYGIFDVKAENIKLIDGKLKIIDANVTRVLAPTLMRRVDELKPKLPKRLVAVARKINVRLSGR